MKVTNELALRMFELDRKQIANFLALFSSLNIGDEYTSGFGKIVKTAEDTFKVVVNSRNYENILEELINSEDDIYDIFKSK